ncbi:TPA: hypothetical protein ACFNM0_001006 [Neisseria lactamica]
MPSEEPQTALDGISICAEKRLNMFLKRCVMSARTVCGIEICPGSRYNPSVLRCLKREAYEPYRRNFAFVPYCFGYGGGQ